MRKAVKVLASWTIPAIFGGIVTYGVTQFQNRLKYLDYRTVKTDIIEPSKQKLPSSIKIIIGNDNKNVVNKISQIQFLLFNLSDQDYENVILHVEILSKSKPSKLFKIIPEQSISNFQENIEIVSQPSYLNNLNSQRYSYKIKILNRPDKIEQPVFQAKYTVIGEISDNLVIKSTLANKGLKLKQLSDEDFWIRKDIWSYFVYKYYWVICVIIVLLALFAEAKFKQYKSLKRQKQYVLSLKNRLYKPGEIDKFKQQLSPSAMAELLIKVHHELYFKTKDEEFTQYFTDKLSQPGEMDKLTQQPSPSAMAEYLLKINQEFRLENIDQEIYIYLRDKLSQPGELEQLKQNLSPLIVAEYLAKIYREFYWRNIPWWRRWMTEKPEP